MKTIELEIPDGKRAEWVNGVLTLVDDKPIEYKFKVGDKVKITVPNNPQYGEITKLGEFAGEPLYTLKSQDAVFDIYERYLEPLPQDITERIKTFEDACDWCNNNGHAYLICHYIDLRIQIEKYKYPSDLLAYLKLRIITCALNEGWKPTFEEDETRYYPYSYTDSDNLGVGVDYETGAISFPVRLCFKSERCAKYAAEQFRDLYADFCGCEKSDNQ